MATPVAGAIHPAGELPKNSWKVKVKAAQSCPTLCDPMDYTVHGILQGQDTGVSSLSLLQGIFPTQGLNPGIPHCGQILYQLNHKGSPPPPKKKKTNSWTGTLNQTLQSQLQSYCSLSHRKGRGHMGPAGSQQSPPDSGVGSGTHLRPAPSKLSPGVDG